MENHKLKGYSLEMRQCNKCRKEKIHEICYHLEEKCDYTVCQSCGETTKEDENLAKQVLNSMARWNK